VPEKLRAFGFDAIRIDPHDHASLLTHLPGGGRVADRPLALVCETVPGAGVPVFEEYRRVHYIRAAAAMWQTALAQLDATAPVVAPGGRG